MLLLSSTVADIQYSSDAVSGSLSGPDYNSISPRRCGELSQGSTATACLASWSLLLFHPHRLPGSYFVRSNCTAWKTLWGFSVALFGSGAWQGWCSCFIQHLRSATQRMLVVLRYRLNSFGRWRLSVAGPSTWNSMPDSLRDPELSLDTFKRQLKTYIFAKYWWQNVLSALEIFLSMRYINLHFALLTYLLTMSHLWKGTIDSQNSCCQLAVMCQDEEHLGILSLISHNFMH